MSALAFTAMMIELIDDFFAEYPATAGSDEVDTAGLAVAVDAPADRGVDDAWIDSEQEGWRGHSLALILDLAGHYGPLPVAPRRKVRRRCRGFYAMRMRARESPPKHPGTFSMLHPAEVNGPAPRTACAAGAETDHVPIVFASLGTARCGEGEPLRRT
jgi:hypothetical protein